MAGPKKKANTPYGLYISKPITNWQLELLVYRDWHKLIQRPHFKSGFQRYEHMKRAICMLFPEYINSWNDWTERMCRAYVDYSYVGAMGCTASTKTHTIHLLGFMDYLADPANTQLVCTTTSLAGLKTRMFPILAAHARKLGGQLTLRTAPHLTIQANPVDYKHAIRGVAVEERADEGTIVDNLIGGHSKRFIWIIDEASSAPQAIIKAWANALAGTEHHRLCALFNPNDQHDTSGQIVRPRGGWDSINEDTEEWEFDFYGEPGLCLHFDGLKSPAITRPELDFGIYGATEMKLHASIKETDPLTYWRFCRGFYAEEGCVPRVISMAEIDKHKCRADVIFKGTYSRFLSLDPAFMGGDRCQLMQWKYGVSIETNQHVMFKEKEWAVPIQPKLDPIPQIGEFVLKRAQEASCTVIGIDCSANNSSVATWLKLNSSMTIHEVSFGGGASDEAVSPTDSTPCDQKYSNKVTELWFTVKNALPQIRGLDAETCTELCSRFFKTEGKPAKMKLESKPDFKKRFGRSPDKADCAAIAVHVFRKLGGFKPAGSMQSAKSWSNLAKRKNSLYNSEHAYT